MVTYNDSIQSPKPNPNSILKLGNVLKQAYVTFVWKLQQQKYNKDTYACTQLSQKQDKKDVGNIGAAISLAIISAIFPLTMGYTGSKKLILGTQSDDKYCRGERNSRADPIVKQFIMTFVPEAQ